MKSPTISSNQAQGYSVERTSRPRRIRRGVLVCALIGVMGLSGGITGRSAEPTVSKPDPRADERLVRELVTSEETGLAVSRRLRRLAQGLFDLRLPGPRLDGTRWFTPGVGVVDLAPKPAASSDRRLRLEPVSWPLAAATSVTESIDLWRPLLSGVSAFDFARFSVVDGAHPDADPRRYRSRVRFDASARMKSGAWRAFQGRLEVTWERQIGTNGPPGDWLVSGWVTESLYETSTPARFFAPMLEGALREPADVARLRRSLHYEATVEYYRGGMKKLPHPYFAPISVNQKEGIAIADVNGDGFDDIYVTVRLGKNLLLVNQGDGTFREQAGDYHLDLPGHTTCALFADFDNDGDLDALLGRSLLKTTYLENREGIYHQHPIPPYMPMAVISMAAADYNRDGLLDVYLCTYRPAAPAGSGMAGGYAQVAKEGDFDWPDEFLAPELAREFRRRLGEHRQRHGVSVLDQLGPPNVLLVNRGGGRFEPAPENGTVGLWRNSLQATWCDYNVDGWPDLYIPNDWGLNVLFRNDGPEGFTDVTRDAGLDVFGFSMGASWGDYDNDGFDDLYVSNMYSDAGRRMVARLPGLDPLFAESASGNFLYHRDAPGRFRQVAGTELGSVPVADAGWSWGGCFADFDNDTFLDLYVLNGYFTAPRELDSELDLESNLWRTMVRADANFARPSFRFSPAWRRTPPPDNLGPEIDTRLSGIERRGDRLLVHSLHGGERNRYYSNRSGRTFDDVSGLSGLDSGADSRGFGLLDYDRDGWTDVALVNANQPLFELFRNEMPALGTTGGVIALRFVGGNRASTASDRYTARDGFGARVTVDLGTRTIVREHRCGEGWSVQNSATLLVGIGAQRSASSVTVRWPSGRASVATDVIEDTLLTVYENPEDAPDGQSFVRQRYRVPGRSLIAPGAHKARLQDVFEVRSLDTSAKPARWRVYFGFATAHPSSVADLPVLRWLAEELGPEGVDIVGVTVHPDDDDTRLGAFARRWNPSFRLVNLPAARRGQAAAAFAKVIGNPTVAPAVVVTDAEGRILSAFAGLPSVSTIRSSLAQAK